MSSRLTPTSMTTAPVLDHVAGDHARPAGGHAEDVGAPAVARRDRACACDTSSPWRGAPRRSWASGLPTRRERPITTASAPSSVDAVVVEDLEAAGRRARHRGRLARRAGGRGSSGCRPSASFAGAMARDRPRPRPAPWAAGAGAGRRGSTRSALIGAIVVEQLRLRAARRGRGSRAWRCRPRRPRASCCARRSAEAGSSPTRTTASVGVTPLVARRARDAGACTSASTFAATALPSRISAKAGSGGSGTRSRSMDRPRARSRDRCGSPRRAARPAPWRARSGSASG